MPSNEKLYHRAVLGGTFDNFHQGHKSLISTACHVASDVFIGVISDVYGKTLFSKKIFNKEIQLLDTRIKSVEDFLESKNYSAEIGVLDEPYGPSITDHTADVIIVSHETRKTADAINAIRLNAGMEVLDIITIPWEFSSNGIIISSSNIRKAKFGKLNQS